MVQDVKLFVMRNMRNVSVLLLITENDLEYIQNREKVSLRKELQKDIYYKVEDEIGS